MLWEAICPPQALFSYWLNQRLREDLSAWHSAGLGEGQWGHVPNAFLTYVMQFAFVFVLLGEVQSCSSILGFSQWCLVHEQLLAVVLVRGNEVRNNPCHHIGDITPSLQSLYFTQHISFTNRFFCGVLLHFYGENIQK